MCDFQFYFSRKLLNNSFRASKTKRVNRKCLFLKHVSCSHDVVVVVVAVVVNYCCVVVAVAVTVVVVVVVMVIVVICNLNNIQWPQNRNLYIISLKIFFTSICLQIWIRPWRSV